MIAVPPKFVARINFKPLVPIEELERINPERVLKSIRNEVLKALRASIMQEPLSPAARKALSRGIKTKLGPKSLTVMATHPAFIPLLKGQKREQMTWLTKSPTPIPIVLDDGTVIFRSATAKSMKDGKWVHPGHEPTTVIERARREARRIVKKRIKKELQRQLRAAMRKMK
jgi:hypothetical protein